MSTTVKKLLRNIFANQIGFLVSALVTFFLSPFVVNSLGGTRYGIWSLIVSLTGNYGLLAFGIQGAMTRYIAHAAATNDQERVNGYFNTALSFLLGSAALATIVGLIIALFIERIFVLPKDLVQEARAACILVTFSSAATFAFAAFDSVLVAHQRFQLTNAVGIVNTLIRAVMTVWILKQGYGIIALAALGTGLTFLNGALIATVAKTCYSWLRLSMSLVSRTYLRELLDYGYKSFTVGIAVALIYQCDLFVVGAYLSPVNVATYSLAATLVTYLVQFIGAIVSTFIPYATGLHSLGRDHELRSFYLEYSCYMFILGGVILSGCYGFGKSFYTLWVGPQYSDSAAILSILSVAFFIDTGTRVCTIILSGMAKIGPLAVAYVCEGLINICLSIVLVQKFGLIGVAYGTVIPNIIVRGIWLQFYIGKVLAVKKAVIIANGFLPGVLVAVTAGFIAQYINNAVEPTRWALFFVNIFLYLLIVVTLVFAVWVLRKVRSVIPAGEKL